MRTDITRLGGRLEDRPGQVGLKGPYKGNDSFKSRYEILMAPDELVGWRIRYRVKERKGAHWHDVYLPEVGPTAYRVEAACAQHEMATSHRGG